METVAENTESNHFMMRPASVLSYVLHPLLMPFYCMLVLFSLPTYLAYAFQFKFQLLIYAMVIITTFLMPTFSAIILFKRGAITDLYLNNRHERIVPFIVTALYYFLCYFLFTRMPVPPIVTDVILGSAVAVSIAFAITLVWKISIHMIGIGGLFGMLIAVAGRLHSDITWPLILTAVVSGLLGSARLIAGKHNAIQIYSGFIIGTLVVFGVLTFFKN